MIFYSEERDIFTMEKSNRDLLFHHSLKGLYFYYMAIWAIMLNNVHEETVFPPNIKSPGMSTKKPCWPKTRTQWLENGLSMISSSLNYPQLSRICHLH